MNRAVAPAERVRETSTRVRVRYAETDKMGVVYYANYLVWFEVARCDWFRQQGRRYRDLEGNGTILPVIEAHCEYRQPTRYDEDVELRTRGRLLSPVRLRFDYEVVRASDGVRAASGWTVHAAVDPQGRPRRLPADVRSLLG